MKIAREALPIALLVALASLAVSFLLHPLAGAAGLPLLGFVLWFFRDPERRPPRDPAAVLSPADGRIIRVGPDRISVFMNVFNVHVCRSPTAGTLAEVEPHAGRFLAAFKDGASEQNERVRLVLDGPAGRVGFTLIAGLVARRIVCKVAAGQRLEAGERVGLIQFGSRVDVELPEGAEPTVARGDRVVAGETRLARLAVPSRPRA